MIHTEREAVSFNHTFTATDHSKAAALNNKKRNDERRNGVKTICTRSCFTTCEVVSSRNRKQTLHLKKKKRGSAHVFRRRGPTGVRPMPPGLATCRASLNERSRPPEATALGRVNAHSSSRERQLRLKTATRTPDTSLRRSSERYHFASTPITRSAQRWPRTRQQNAPSPSRESPRKSA